MIYPSNTAKQVWDMVVMLLLIYTAIFVPIKVCFLESSSDVQFIIDLVVDFLFLTDIVLTFNTALEDQQGIYIVKRAKIAKAYCLGWFFIDFFTSIPSDAFEKLQELSPDDSNN